MPELGAPPLERRQPASKRGWPSVVLEGHSLRVMGTAVPLGATCNAIFLGPYFCSDTATKISRLETGRAGASLRDIRDLCIVYGITDTAERERLMALAREGRQRAWCQQFDLPYATYIGLEAEVTSIGDYNTDVATGLLQVEDYARAIFQTSEPPLDPTTIEQRIEARVKRQALLTQDDGPLFHCILDEAALHRPVGGLAVMRAQLTRSLNLPVCPRSHSSIAI